MFFSVAPDLERFVCVARCQIVTHTLRRIITTVLFLPRAVSTGYGKVRQSSAISSNGLAHHANQITRSNDSSVPIYLSRTADKHACWYLYRLLNAAAMDAPGELEDLTRELWRRLWGGGGDIASEQVSVLMIRMLSALLLL